MLTSPGLPGGLKELVHVLCFELLMLPIILFGVLPFLCTHLHSPVHSLLFSFFLPPSPFLPLPHAHLSFPIAIFTCLVWFDLLWSNYCCLCLRPASSCGTASLRAKGLAAQAPQNCNLHFPTLVLWQPVVLLNLPFTEAPSAKDYKKIKASNAKFFLKHATSDELGCKVETLALGVINETEGGSREKMWAITFIL